MIVVYCLDFGIELVYECGKWKLCVIVVGGFQNDVQIFVYLIDGEVKFEFIFGYCFVLIFYLLGLSCFFGNDVDNGVVV